MDELIDSIIDKLSRVKTFDIITNENIKLANSILEDATQLLRDVNLTVEKLNSWKIGDYYRIKYGHGIVLGKNLAGDFFCLELEEDDTLTVNNDIMYDRVAFLANAEKTDGATFKYILSRYGLIYGR